MIKIESIHKNYAAQSILKDISFQIAMGETLGLVGESGSGKSTLAKLLLRIEKPCSGTIYFKDVNLTALSRKGLKPYRKKIQMIFQDPYSSLNPRMTVEQILHEPLLIHSLEGSPADLLQQVGLKPDCLQRYPHEFSGGQRQRIAIARALAVQPELLVCDESISALDMTTQHQILALLQELKQSQNLTILFISHDLLAVREIATRIAVMQHGQIVEIGKIDQIFENPMHPYTRALLKAIL